MTDYVVWYSIGIVSWALMGAWLWYEGEDISVKDALFALVTAVFGPLVAVAFGIFLLAGGLIWVIEKMPSQLLIRGRSKKGN